MSDAFGSLYWKLNIMDACKEATQKAAGLKISSKVMAEEIDR